VKTVLTNAYVEIDSVDATTYTQAIRLTFTAEEIDDTPLGAVPYRTTMDGERSISVEVDVLAGNDTLRQSLQTAYNAGTAVDVVFRPRNAAQSPTNPTVTVSCVVTGFAPFGGTVGEAAKPMIRLAATGAETIDTDQLIAALVLEGLLMVAA